MTPKFAVVGHPNKGKSSIVATLVESQAIDISPVPGTTYKADTFELQINGSAVYALVDTPGFQRAAAVLEWLRAHTQDASGRAAAVARFIETFAVDPQFQDECELLRPIVEGAGILYVVDGAKPYSREYEIQMQILQWTGRPRMALINQIGDGDYIDDWQQALGQYFSIVKVFDAFHADFDKRIDLLNAFGVLDESWQAGIQRAIDLLRAQRAQRLQQSAQLICQLLCQAATAQTHKGIGEGMDDNGREDLFRTLSAHLHDQIRRLETNTRDSVQALYAHQRTERHDTELPLLQEDLFAEQSWEVFGLSRTALVASAGFSGALAGGGIDAILGGSSLLLGTLGGAVIGSVSAWFGGDELAKVEVLGSPLGGDVMYVGPIVNPNFLWVLFGRAVFHHRIIRERNHAVTAAIEQDVSEQENLMDTLTRDTRNALAISFAKLRKGDTSVTVQREIQRQISDVLDTA
ncbi:MAG: GTPase/DUF3482 domain-containing protein [Pseudomonadota bacterium]